MKDCKECEGLGRFDFEHLGWTPCEDCNGTGRADGRNPLDPLPGEDRDKAIANAAHCLSEPWLHKTYLSEVEVEKEGDKVTFVVERRTGFTYTYELTSVEPNNRTFP